MFKGIILLLLCGIVSLSNTIIRINSPRAFVTYYIDSNPISGNDINNGTSPLTPWKTLAKVASHGLGAGDIVLLARGGTWTEALVAPSSGSSGNPITLDAYGTGDLPIIDAGNTRTNCINLNNKAWLTIRNVRCINATSINEFQGAIIFGNSLIQGIVLDGVVIENNRGAGIAIGGVSTTCISYSIINSRIVRNGSFGILGQNAKPFPIGSSLISNNFVDSNGMLSKVYAREIGDLQGNWGGVEISFNEIAHAAPGIAKDDLTSHGIYVAGPTQVPANIHNNYIHDNPNGDGIKCRYSTDAYDNLLVNNHHGGIEPGQNVDTSSAYNIYDNTIIFNSLGQATQAFPGINVNNGPVGIAHVKTLNVYNNTVYINTFIGSGNEISISYAPDTLRLKNNIFWSNAGRPTANIANQTGYVEMDYNEYWSNAGSFSSTYKGVTSSTFASWKAVVMGSNNYHIEAHGFTANPVFTNTGTRDFSLLPTSPAIDAGVDVGLPFLGTKPDMGANEFIAPIVPSTIPLPTINHSNIIQ